MNTLFSLALVASVLASAMAADACTEVVDPLAESSGGAGKIKATIKGTLDTPASNNAADVLLLWTVASDSSTTVPVSGTPETVGTIDLSGTNFVDGAAVDSTEALTASTDYIMQIKFTPAGASEIECPLVCGVTSAYAGTSALCPAEECTAAVAVDYTTPSQPKFTISGTLPLAYTGDVTLAYTAKNDGGAIADQTVAVTLGNTFTDVSVEATAPMTETDEYDVVISFPGINWAGSPATVSCPAVTVSKDGAVTTEAPDAAAAMSASVFVLVAAFVARAF